MGHCLKLSKSYKNLRYKGGERKRNKTQNVHSGCMQPALQLVLHKAVHKCALSYARPQIIWVKHCHSWASEAPLLNLGNWCFHVCGESALPFQLQRLLVYLLMLFVLCSPIQVFFLFFPLLFLLFFSSVKLLLQDLRGFFVFCFLNNPLWSTFRETFLFYLLLSFSLYPSSLPPILGIYFSPLPFLLIWSEYKDWISFYSEHNLPIENASGS